MSFHVCSQHKTINPELKKKLRYNQYFLSQFSIELNNGNIPFQENKKWGIKNGEQVVIQPIYDTLINLTYDFFAAKNDTTCQLFDQALNAYFDSSVIRISPTSVFQELKVLHKDGKISYYTISKQIAYDNEMRQLLVSDIKPKDIANNQLLPKPVSIGTNQSNPKKHLYAFYPYKNNYCDSITVSQIIGVDKTHFQFYRKGKKYGEMALDNVMSRYLRDSVLCLEFREKDAHSSLFQLINIKTLEKIASFEGELGTCFKHEEQFYFWTSQNRVISIYDLSGNLVVTPNERFSYVAGCFRKEINQQQGIIDLYSFPDQDLLYSNIRQIRENDGFYLFRKLDNKEYILFYNNHYLYSFKGKQPVFYSTKSLEETNSALLTIWKDGRCMVFSTKNLVHVSKNILEAQYDEHSKQLILTREVEESGRSIKYGVYLSDEDKIHVLPSEFAKVDSDYSLLDSSTMLFYETTDDSDQMRCFFQDLSGSCLDTVAYSDLSINYLKERYVIQVSRKNGVPRVYYGGMNLICDSCYISFDPYDDNNHDYLSINRNIRDIYIESLDEDLQSVFPEKYLAISYCHRGKYFRVLDRNYQISYIPVSETNLLKPE